MLSTGTKIGDLDDVERRNGPYSALFTKFGSFRGPSRKDG